MRTAQSSKLPRNKAAIGVAAMRPVPTTASSSSNLPLSNWVESQAASDKEHPSGMNMSVSDSMALKESSLDVASSVAPVALFVGGI